MIKYQFNPLFEYLILKVPVDNPKVKHSLIGAGTGALVGGLTGTKKDKNGETHILRNATAGLGIGLGAGYANGSRINTNNTISKKVKSWLGDPYARVFKTMKGDLKVVSPTHKELLYYKKIKGIEGGYQFAPNKFYKLVDTKHLDDVY